MRRVCFLGILALFVSFGLSVEAAACSVHVRHRHHIATCPHHPDVPSGETTLGKAKLEAQKIIDEAKRTADGILRNASLEADGIKAGAQRDADNIKTKAAQDADGIKASAQRDADSIKTKAAQDADGIKVGAQRDADNIKAKASEDADNIKASAQREKRDADTLMAGAVATQKSAADQIDQANRSKQEFDNRTQELKDKIKEAQDTQRRAGEAQTVFEEATRKLAADRQGLVERVANILGTENVNCWMRRRR